EELVAEVFRRRAAAAHAPPPHPGQARPPQPRPGGRARLRHRARRTASPGLTSSPATRPGSSGTTTTCSHRLPTVVGPALSADMVTPERLPGGDERCYVGSSGRACGLAASW